MTDITVIIVSAESTLHEVAKQAQALATGLQNVAPSDKVTGASKSVTYLLEVAEKANETAALCKKLIHSSPKEQNEKLQEVAMHITKHDQALRESYQIGDKFRFVRDKLQALQTEILANVAAVIKETTQHTAGMTEDETMVYVYLFNAQGITLQTWQKMVNPAVFYEHSVNRPIYTAKDHIESFINRKANKVQHGYLTIVIPKSDILPATEETPALNDVYGNPVIKVREGSLSFKKLSAFTHNGLDYIVDEDGAFVKKL